jgi:hypothetical protein
MVHSFMLSQKFERRRINSKKKGWNLHGISIQKLGPLPETQLTELYNIDEDEKQKATPSHMILMRHLESLYWMWRAGKTRHDRRWSCHCPPNQSRQILCNVAATSSSNTPTVESERGHPILLPLYSSSSALHTLPSSTYLPCLFIYTSELEFIFNELEVVFRPMAYLRTDWSNRGPVTKSDNNYAPLFADKWFNLGHDIAERISRHKRLVRRADWVMISRMAGVVSLVLLCSLGGGFMDISCYIGFLCGLSFSASVWVILK